MLESKRPSVYIQTLGCKLNQAERDDLGQSFLESGFDMVNVPPADICIINTCTVTTTADHKSRQCLRRLRRLCPDSTIVATGCYSERAAEQIKSSGIADIIVGNREKHNLPSIILDHLKIKLPQRPPGSFQARTRSFVKIQYGCENQCSYCVVPTVRPREVSVRASDILARIRSAVSSGIHEVILTGTRVGAYSFDGLNLSGLIETLLTETSIERVRISSVQPHELDESLISLWENPRLCPHFHIALQSGSDRILRLMHRPYDTDVFSKAVKLIRLRVPGAAITTDVIVGFPGETESDFRDSLEYCRISRFAGIHAFSFSSRPNTPAAGFDGAVSEPVRHMRLQSFLILAKESSRLFRQQFIGNVMPILWESRPEAGDTISGLTPNYMRVETIYQPGLDNTIASGRLVAFKGSTIKVDLT